MKNQKSSHPMWVRGLKLLYKKIIIKIKKSHPMWVRGLKFDISIKFSKI